MYTIAYREGKTLNNSWGGSPTQSDQNISNQKILLLIFC